MDAEARAVKRAATEQDCARVSRALGRKRYADALFILGESVEERRLPQRATMWRGEAAKIFREPAAALQPLAVKNLADSIERWLARNITDHKTQARMLRKLFAELVFPGHLIRTDTPPNRYWAECAVFQILLVGQLSQSFLPQLHAFNRLEIVTTSTPVDDPGFVQAALTAARQTHSPTGNHLLTLAVILAPGLKAALRERTLKEFRKEGSTAALIDDVDLCRLVTPDPRPNQDVLALLEIVLEQQRLKAVAPFNGGQDGSHVQCWRCSWAGATRRTRLLSITGTRVSSPAASWVKSALLKFVQGSADGTDCLPASSAWCSSRRQRSTASTTSSII